MCFLQEGTSELRIQQNDGEKDQCPSASKRADTGELSARLQVAGCDLTRSALAKIEVGQRHLYPDEIKALKTALGVGYEELFV